MEPYVYKIKNRQERSLPAKLRFGTLPLQVEIGRWKNIKFEDRVCQICHTGVEDENHLVFYCSGYNEERHNFENNMCSIQKKLEDTLMLGKICNSYAKGKYSDFYKLLVKHFS